MKELKNNLKLTFNELNHFVKEVVFDIKYYLPLFIITILAYGFNLFNRTVFIDDLAQDLYYGSGNIKLRGLRWGQWITNRIFSTIDFTPFINKFLGILFLVLTVVVLGAIFYSLDANKQNKWKYTIFSCLFVSYPLINEFWEYYEALTIPFQFLLVSLSIYYLLINKELNVKNIVFIGIAMSFIMSGYESLVFTYIFLVLIILYKQYVLEDKKGWFLEGLRYAYPLFIALILRFVIGYLILLITGLTYEMDGAESIVWLDEGIKAGLMGTLYNGFIYVVRGLSYFPIGEFVITLILYLIYIVKNQFKHKYSLLFGLLMLIAMFGLGILQGTRMLYRTAQSLYIFVALGGYLFFDKYGNGKCKNILLILLLFVSYRQAVFMHKILALDNQRSNNEAAVVQNIGYELSTNYDLNKTIIFCGEYNIGENIENQISIKPNSLADKVENKIKDIMGDEDIPYYNEYVYSNVSSVLNWGRKSFDGQVMLKRYFSYYGYDINVLDNWDKKDGKSESTLIRKYTDIAEKENMRPLSIKDMDDYILVYFGPYLNEE